MTTQKGFPVQLEAFFKRWKGPSGAAEEVTQIFSQMVLKIDGVLRRLLRLNSIPGSKIIDKIVCPCSPLVTFPKTPAERLQLSCCGHTDDPESLFLVYLWLLADITSCGYVAFWSERPTVRFCFAFTVTLSKKKSDADAKSCVIETIFQTQHLSTVSQLGQTPLSKEKKDKFRNPIITIIGASAEISFAFDRGVSSPHHFFPLM